MGTESEHGQKHAYDLGRHRGAACAGKHQQHHRGGRAGMVCLPMGVVPLNGVGLAMMSATGRRALLVIAAALVLGIANPARAELIYFSCSGTLETRGANSKQVEPEPWTESLTFDTDKKTVKPASDDPLPVEVKDDSVGNGSGDKISQVRSILSDAKSHHRPTSYSITDYWGYRAMALCHLQASKQTVLAK